MKTKVRYLICFSSLVSCTAFAGSMTLFGIVDGGLTFSSNAGGKANYIMQSGIAQGSRWGLRGVEDLAAETSVIFQLENGFDLMTGKIQQAGALFGRQAWVGIDNGTLGRITMGRQYDSLVDFLQPTTMNGHFGALFSHAGDVDNTDNGYRINNSVKYRSPKWGGFSFGAAYAFGNVAGSFGAQSTMAAGLSYSLGCLYIAAAYLKAKNPVQQFPDGNFFAGDTIYGTTIVTPATSQQRTFGVGVTWGDIVGIDYTNVKFLNALDSQSVNFSNYEAWGQWQFNAAVTGGLGYTWTSARINARDESRQYGQLNVMLDYLLSKRTDVYVMGVWQRAFGDNAVAAVYPAIAGSSTTRSQIVARVGMRHKF
ncbi:porin [Burkholderia multivorans]|uniref:porin n=1 Tax=Burkholderia multivorans TaxID=87883 RepID=UPI001C247B62|nr:porin [Burkholderia multivorans]MBU9479613.1 porin [Burkholderia multivorans]